MLNSTRTPRQAIIVQRYEQTRLRRYDRGLCVSGAQPSKSIHFTKDIEISEFDWARSRVGVGVFKLGV